MSKKLDLTGKKFGRLTVIGLDEEKTKLKHATYWVCKCECGNMMIVKGAYLMNGTTKSCGCLQKDKARITCISRSKHNLSKNRMYNIWRGMIKRCYKEYDKNYCRYGARGIKMCDEWLNDFINFYNWAMDNGYEDDLTIDRINNDGNYEPSNCRWTTHKVQGNNRRDNVYLVIDGEKKTLMEWYETYKPNMLYTSFAHRYEHEGFQSVDQLFRDKAS